MLKDNETRLVTTLIFDESQYYQVDGVSVPMFTDPLSRQLFETITELKFEGLTVDLVTLAKHSKLKSFEISDFLDRHAPSAAMIKYDCAEIIQGWQQREITTLLKIGATGTPQEISAEIKTKLDEILSCTIGNIRTFKESMNDWRDSYSDWYDGKKPIGIGTGYWFMDEILRYKPGNLITLGARTAVGKTTFALNQLCNIALSGVKCGIISLEMSSDELIDKILGIISNLSTGEIYKNESFARVFKKTIEIENTQMMIEAPLFNDTEKIFNIARKMVTQGAKIIVIDYLQLMFHRGNFQNRNYEIGKITSSLKVLASELQIPIVILSQLKRKDGNPRPVLSDLRDSGSIEQDSNIVMFLHQPEAGYDHIVNIDCLVEKNRGGAVGKGELIFDKRLSKINSGV